MKYFRFYFIRPHAKVEEEGWYFPFFRFLFTNHVILFLKRQFYWDFIIGKNKETSWNIWILVKRLGSNHLHKYKGGRIIFQVFEASVKWYLSNLRLSVNYIQWKINCKFWKLVHLCLFVNTKIVTKKSNKEHEFNVENSTNIPLILSASNTCRKINSFTSEYFMNQGECYTRYDLSSAMSEDTRVLDKS